jgi:hypothetical protein
MYAVADPDRHRIAGFACGCRSCFDCGPKWIEDNREWFWSIVAQFKPIHQTVTSGATEAAKIKKQIWRAGGFYVSLPLANGQALWFSNVATSTSKIVAEAEAWKAFSYAIEDLRDLPDSQKIRSSRCLAIAHAKDREEPREEWRAVPEAGNITGVEWKEIESEAAAVDPKFSFDENYERDRCGLTMRCSRERFYSMLERLMPGYTAPMGSNRVRVAVRSGTLVLCRSSEGHAGEISQNSGELSSVF